MIPFVAAWSLRKAAPYIAIAVLSIALVGLWTWDRHTINALKAEKVAAIERADAASQDASRWHKAAEERRASIERLNAEMAKLVKDYAETQQAALELLDEAQERADATERRLAKLRKEGTDAPLNDTARSAADYGLCRARAIVAGADPGAC